MAFVVARADGRFEIRESVVTGAGPRARTLATFRHLTPEVLDHAELRATRPFDRDGVADRAVALGAPVTGDDVLRSAYRLLTALEAGAALPSAIGGMLAERLGTVRGGVPDSLPPLADWVGQSATARGHALRDLLRMTDRLPQHRRRRGRRFPRIASAPG